MTLPFPRHRPPRLLLQSSDGGDVEQQLKSRDWAIVSRAEFGRALLERALGNGRMHHLRQRVKDVERTEEGWLVHTAAGQTSSADFLVGADGVHSLVRRKVVAPIPRQHLALAVGYQARGAPDAIVFQTYADLEGYLWSFPRTDHAGVGIPTRLSSVPSQELWQRVDRFLAETYPQAKKERRWAGLLPMAQDTSLWDTSCAGPEWALLGDAAGHVHPMTGEGIAYALWSAELLAEAFEQGNPEVYDGLWRERYGRGLMAAIEMARSVDLDIDAYEILFHVAIALSVPDQAI